MCQKPPPDCRSAAGQAGFTMVDVLFVLAVIVILLGLAFPQYTAVLRKAQAAEVDRVFADQRRELELFRIDHASYGDGSASSSTCGVVMPEGRFFSFQCTTRHDRGPDLEYQIVAVPRTALSEAPGGSGPKVTAALFSVNQDGDRSERVVIFATKKFDLACLPTLGASC